VLVPCRTWAVAAVSACDTAIYAATTAAERARLRRAQATLDRVLAPPAAA
jgi:hypothetical protein